MPLPSHLRRATAAALATAAAALLAAGCGSDGSSRSTGSSRSGGSSAPNDGAELSLVSYSTPREAFEALVPKFNETDEGSGVTFKQSYGASGEQSRAVEGGLPADVVEFSLEPDMTRLVDADMVAPDWNANEYRGMVTESVVVLVVRKGNPKGIRTWDDLLDKGVEIVTPNPFTSGGARWNLMAAYGAWIHEGSTPEEALANVKALLENTPVQAPSAREALQAFSQGEGDVLISYENEAITANDGGEEIEFVMPDSTILIENPVAVTSTSKEPEAAKAFVKYLYSDEAQKVFGEAGYRPVVDDVAKGFDFPEAKDQFTIQEFGGWDKVMDQFFDRETGSVAKIEQQLGVETDA